MNAQATYDVVLLPSFSQVQNWRKRQAKAHPGGIFGQTVCTFDAWMAELWELHGDGRRLVDGLQRSVLLRAAFSRMAREGQAGDLPLTPGLAVLAARCEMQAAGVAAYEKALQLAEQGQGIPDLSEREQLFLRAIAGYRRHLRRAGLLELGEACAALASDAPRVFPRALRVLVDEAEPLDWRMQAFFAACGMEVELRLAAGSEGIQRLASGIVPRFAFPSGRYATPAVIAQLLGELRAGEQAVVTCANPLALYRELEPALAELGLVGAVQARMPFGQISLGSAYLQLYRVVRDKAQGAFDAAALADVVRSPFAGFSSDAACAFDARLRADRIADAEAYVRELAESSEPFALLLQLATGDGFEAALAAIEQRISELPGHSGAWRAEQQSAVEALRGVRRLADAHEVAWEDCVAVLEQLMLSVQYAGLASGRASGAAQRIDLVIATQEEAARLAPGSYALVIACDLTAECYPLADADDAASSLLRKLGLAPVEDALAHARRSFTALLQLASRSLVCLRPLNDVNGDAAYACAMLQELVDAYREGEAEGDASCDPSDLPAALSEGIVVQGEERLVANALARPSVPHCAAGTMAPVAALGDVGAASPDALLLPRRGAQGEQALLRSPSPSQVESYLECPYKWLVSRRLDVKRLEEGFGPLEKGSFAHLVLERFYRRFQREVAPKVSAGHLSQARALLQQEADALERELRQAAPGSGRLVAATALEEQAIGQLKRQLLDHLAYECEFLPGFRPAYFEYAFTAQSAPEYGGCRMVGTVDRIDVDDAGHAVIIDYKSSLSAEHEIAGKDAAHPGKVQARIYAQLVQRALGLQVVGALYLSYGKGRKVAGAVDSRVLEAAQVPGASPEGPWCALTDSEAGQAASFAELSFAQMLDATEQVVARAVAGMQRGDAAPRPASADACTYCVAVQCPRRMG